MTDSPTFSSQNTTDKTPWTIVMLLIGGGLFTTAQFYKCAQVLINWSALTGLGLGIPPIYLALAGLMWGLIGSLSIWSIWTRKTWSPLFTILTAIIYGILFWIDQVFISHSENILRRWPINLAFTILGLGALIMILSQKSTQSYFGKNTVKIP